MGYTLDELKIICMNALNDAYLSTESTDDYFDTVSANSFIYYMITFDVDEYLKDNHVKYIKKEKILELWLRAVNDLSWVADDRKIKLAVRSYDALLKQIELFHQK